MEIISKENIVKDNLLAHLKSFLIWCFTLSICFLVVGFPLGFILVTLGVLATLVLNAIMPINAVIVVSSSILALNVLVVLLSAATLTIKKIQPQSVSWLSWLHGDAKPHHDTIYASYPLTCSLTES
ncbi:MAG: hypothetical protein ACFBSE_16540 [Prochloraceae cyanobacterium]